MVGEVQTAPARVQQKFPPQGPNIPPAETPGGRNCAGVISKLGSGLASRSRQFCCLIVLGFMPGKIMKPFHSPLVIRLFLHDAPVRIEDFERGAYRFACCSYARHRIFDASAGCLYKSAGNNNAVTRRLQRLDCVYRIGHGSRLRSSRPRTDLKETPAQSSHEVGNLIEHESFPGRAVSLAPLWRAGLAIRAAQLLCYPEWR